ncbi:ABC1 kinase family protein [Saccharothrix algeriensis]|uniref:AarF/ABC1/UbiB kinase family protein n=1 Tax=Saccharothrix algeriensis TaxID=173560 RepID=A0A8T8HT03_9PSEU|nr:AarF/UbiB family protein [Saccharothrix algeriensis]MBM7813051.1 ubiquinone biosynthesis protein [Saccharothrix algeriensis]QTR01662.1 AarF/ABC1/UbiB kinase family protein [Saccharothrix algeriensis]
MSDFLVYTIGVPATFLALVLGIALAARRILGLRVGLVRTALACLVGLSLTQGVLSGMPGPETTRALGTVQLGIALLLMIALLTFAEIVAPTGSVPPPTEWWRALRRRVARARRYSRITAIAFRHGLGPYLRGRERTDTGLARSLRLALQDGGITFVKLGQVLSTRPDLLPADVVAELSRLQDEVPAAPWPAVRAVLLAELGAPEEVFAEFDETPVAAASVAQVHRARLKSGEDVVVKVQRPGVRRVAEGDLDIVTRLAASLHDRTRWGRALGVRDLAAGFSAALREELDFRVEARNLAAVRAASAGGSVVLPAVHEELCTERVLVMERLDGAPVRSAALESADRDALARSLLDALLRQVMVDGVFHADPHPGNVLLLRDGRLGMLDFGSVGRIDGQLRSALGELLLAVDHGDPAGLRDALLELVTRPDEIDEQQLERALGQFMARHLGAGMRPDVEMFGDLFKLVYRYGLAIPPEVAAVFRALATAEGTLGALSPGFNVVVESRAFAERQFSERLSPESLRRTVTEELYSVLPMLKRLPRRAERISSALEQGRLGLNLRLFADERDRHFLLGVLHQVMLTVLGATAGLMAVLLLGADGGPPVAPDITLYQVLGYNLLVISVLLGLRVVVTVFRPRSGT